MSAREETTATLKLVGPDRTFPLRLPPRWRPAPIERAVESLLVSRILARIPSERARAPRARSWILIPPGRRITRPSAYDFIRGGNWLSYSPSDHEHGAS